MNEQQKVQISDEQMTGAIGAGLTLLNLDTTLIPGNMRKQLAVLEVVLIGLSQGAMVIASPDQLAVESASEDTGSEAVSAAVKTAAQALAAGAGSAERPQRPEELGAEDDGITPETDGPQERLDTGSQEGRSETRD